MLVCVCDRSEYEKKLKAIEEDEARAKKQKREEKRAKKSVEAPVSSSERAKETPGATADAAVSDADAEMMAMMGFGGFGGSKKN